MRRLAAGLETLVLERQASIRRGAFGDEGGATALETVFRLDTPRSLYHPVQRIRVASPGASTTLEIEEICILDVRGFYRWLGARAATAGARVLTRHSAKEPLLESGAVVGGKVSCENATFDIRARVVVDASGHRAGFSKAAGLHPGFTRFGIGAEYELSSSSARQSGRFSCRRTLGSSRLRWSFPWGENRVRLGVGVHHVDVRDDPREKLKLLRSGKRPLRARSRRCHGRRTPLRADPGGRACRSVRRRRRLPSEMLPDKPLWWPEGSASASPPVKWPERRSPRPCGQIDQTAACWLPTN